MKATGSVAIVIVFIGTLEVAASAQQPASNAVLEAVTACRTERDNQERLRCFDAAATALQRATASGAVVVVDKADVRRTRRSLFGFALPKLPFFSGDDTADEAPQELEAKIVSARGLADNKWLFVLDSGAVWQTTQASPYLRSAEPGQMVKLRKGSLGAYFASVDGSRSVRAMRVR